MTISSIGLSRALEKDEPELALRLFPINVEAFLNGAVMQLNAGQGGGAIAIQASSFLATHAADARLYSLIGETHRRAGAMDEAATAFRQALSLSKTEVTALQWSLQHSLEQGDLTAALDQLDVLFRRWPSRIAPLAGIVPQVFAEVEPYQMLVARLADNPPWRRGLINALARQPQSLAFLARLLPDLAAGPIPPAGSELNAVLSALLQEKRYDVAYRAFILTLTPEEQAVSGYIHNGRFQISPTGRPFDWQMRDHPGLTVSYPGVNGGREGGGLRVQFNNTPVRNLSLRQTLLLPSGGYAFDVAVSAQNASLPKGLLWRITCAGSNKVIAEALVAPGTYQAMPSKVMLTVPDEDCPLQTLFLTTKAIGENWNDRYSGAVIFDDFRVTAVGS